jgi:copper chaperone CopZ
MKSILLMVSVFFINAGHTQISNAKTTIVKIYGNCDMCKTSIEKAAGKKKISKIDWNKDSKMATITYDSKKTSLDAVLKNIALAGYDNEKFLAPDEAYNKLPGCCKYERKDKIVINKTVTEPATTGNNHSGHTQKEITTAAAENQLQAVFDNYFAVKDALVKTDGTAASEKAASLLSALNAVKMDKLKTDEHMAWMKVQEQLKEDAEHISGTKDIEHQREHFISLSKNMIVLIKAAKPSGTVYLQHCPMANEGKGADWLSKESGVKNPYYGSKMLTCGKTIETIQ